MSQPMVAVDVDSFPVPDNVSFTSTSSMDGPSVTDSLLYHTPKVALGLGLLFVLVLVKALRGGRKYPAGVKPLPKLPGKQTRVVHVARILLTYSQVFHGLVGSGMSLRQGWIRRSTSVNCTRCMVPSMSGK